MSIILKCFLIVSVFSSAAEGQWNKQHTAKKKKLQSSPTNRHWRKRIFSWRENQQDTLLWTKILDFYLLLWYLLLFGERPAFLNKTYIQKASIYTKSPVFPSWLSGESHVGDYFFPVRQVVSQTWMTTVPLFVRWWIRFGWLLFPVGQIVSQMLVRWWVRCGWPQSPAGQVVSHLLVR